MPEHSENSAARNSVAQIKIVTNPNKPNDGFGENFKLLIYSVMYAEFNQLGFVYSPFKEMEHNYDKDPNYLIDKETLINFIYNFPSISNRPQLSYRVLDTFELLRFYQTNIEWCSNSSSLTQIKHLFRLNKQTPFLTPDVKTTNIAIHIRRMNSQDYNRTNDKSGVLAGMDVPFDLYLNTMNQFNAAIPNAAFHIYSQGSAVEFEKVFITEANKSRVFLHINENIEDTFTQLVYADILVTSPSALSYSAALLSNNQVYYIEFCNPPLPTWNVIQGYKSSRIKHEFVISIPTPVFYDPYTDKIIRINL